MSLTRPRRFSSASSVPSAGQSPACHPAWGNDFAAFCHHRLVLPVLKSHIYKTILCALLQLAFSLTIMFLSLSQVLADRSFLMLSGLLNEFKNLLIHSSVGRHLGTFMLGAVIHGIALNAFVSVGMRFPFSWANTEAWTWWFPGFVCLAL